MAKLEAEGTVDVILLDLVMPVMDRFASSTRCGRVVEKRRL